MRVVATATNIGCFLRHSPLQLASSLPLGCSTWRALRHGSVELVVKLSCASRSCFAMVISLDIHAR